MTGTIAHLSAAGLFLLLTHFGISSTPLRAALVGRLGEKPYLGLYSLISALAFWWLVAAYNAAPHVPLWPPACGLAWVPILLVPVALFLLVAGLSTPNPTSVGQERLLAGDREPVRGILRVTRNPFLWGVGLWAVAHMVPNGDLASLILFGTLALLALGGSVLIDAKLARRLGADWDRYAARTSNLPFAAILAGRQSLVWREIGWWRPAVALLVYGGLLHLHRMLFGASPLPW
ncbi:NnrU family protein [Azospirillum argentinense]|uniref:NnrU domain-containing protein n=1 Tax=Azospirillum argentinense TaxID=2970906 RepID=A0A5B0KW49_9PROT|nr:NnrU family protein [Azospirillum argentinense]KAA1056957.1 NnrU family protein, required for expression of nitric oxide and nitrite reductases (Nir and Nor) [Azospirillum argentinense]